MDDTQTTRYIALKALALDLLTKYKKAQEDNIDECSRNCDKDMTSLHEECKELRTLIDNTKKLKGWDELNAIELPDGSFYKVKTFQGLAVLKPFEDKSLNLKLGDRVRIDIGNDSKLFHFENANDALEFADNIYNQIGED